MGNNILNRLFTTSTSYYDNTKTENYNERFTDEMFKKYP